MSNSYLRTLHTNLRKIASSDQKEEIRYVMELFLNGVNLLSKDEKGDLFQENEAYQFDTEVRVDRVINHVNFASKLSHVLHNLTSLLLTTIHLQLHLSRNSSSEYYIRTFGNDQNSITRIVTGSQLAEMSIPDEDKSRYTKVSNILIVQFRRYVQRLISNVTPKLASYIAKNVFLAPKSLSYSETEVKLVRYEDKFVRTCFENIPAGFVSTVSAATVEEYFKESWLKSKKTGDKHSIGEYTEKNLKYIMAKTVKANKEGNEDSKAHFSHFISKIKPFSAVDLSEIETAIANGVKVEDAVPAINSLSMFFDSLETLDKFSFISYAAHCSLNLGCNEYLCYIDTLRHVTIGDKVLRDSLGKKVKGNIVYTKLSKTELAAAIDAIKRSDVASDRAIASVFKSFGNVSGSSRKHVSAAFENFIMRTKGQELNEKMKKSMDSNMNKVRRLSSDINDKALSLVKKVAFIPRRNHFSTLSCLESLSNEFETVRSLNSQEARNEVLPGFIQTFCMITNGLYKTRPAEGAKKEEIIDEELQRQINIFALAAKISPKVETEAEADEMEAPVKTKKSKRVVEETKRPSSPVARPSSPSARSPSVSSPSRNVIRSDGSTAPKTGSGRPRAEDLEADSDSGKESEEDN